jgi:hypothetical protein
MARFARWSLLLFAALAAAGPAPRARAAQDTDSCTMIGALPAEISAPGTYCVDTDRSLASGGPAIAIHADNVVLDCNGHRVAGTGGPTASQYGIDGQGHANIVVRHCVISGFLWGAYFDNAAGATIEDNHFTGNLYAAMRLSGTASVARRNRIDTTGGSTVTPWAIGIDLHAGADAIDNAIDGVVARAGGGGNAYGVYLQGDGLSSVVARNRIRNVTRDGAGVSVGIHADSFDRLVLRDNDLVASPAGGTALQCDTAGGSKARGNAISGWTTAFANCVDATRNVVHP